MRKKKRRSTSLILWFDKHSGSIVAISTVILACATIVYVLLTFNILRQNKKQAELVNRPYLGLGTYNVRSQQNKFTFELSLINVGVQPATDVKIAYDWSPVEKGLLLQQKVNGKLSEIKRGQVQNIYLGAPTTIFPEVIFVKIVSLEYNHTLEYWLKKYDTISLIITIYYRGVELKKQENYYRSKVKLSYRHATKKWDVERYEIY